jgi:transcription initiation factor TFIIIB Brf1 subunit/transcription initiation factor TFIIB
MGMHGLQSRLLYDMVIKNMYLRQVPDLKGIIYFNHNFIRKSSHQSFHQSFNTMESCKYCGSIDLVDMSDMVACRDCGCDQDIKQFVVSYDMVHHVAEFKPESHKCNKLVRESLDHIQSFLKTPDSINESAEKILNDYMILTGLNIRSADREGLAVAAIYYASRDSQIPLTMKKIIDEYVISQEVLSTSCNSLKEILSKHKNWSKLFLSVHEKNREIGATSKIIQGLQLQQDQERELRSKLHKVHERITGQLQVMSHHPTTLAAAMVYIAAKASKIKGVTMTKVSKYSNITMASIISVEKVLLKIIQEPRSVPA